MKQLLTCLLIGLIAIPGFSQSTIKKDESSADSKSAGLKKIDSGSQFRNRNFNVNIDEEALEASIELAVRDAMRSVEQVLEKLEIHIEPIEINLNNLDLNIDPIVINTPKIDVNVDPIDIDLDDMDFDMVMDIDVDIDDDRFDWDNDDEDNDSFFQKEKAKEKEEKEKMKSKEKEKSDKQINQEKDMAKGLKKIN
jgi:hypothetical protein